MNTALVRGGAALTALAVLLGLAVATRPVLVLPLLAVSILFTLAVLVVTAVDPRRVGVAVMCLFVPFVTMTGISAVGPLSVAELTPMAIFAVTLLPGVVDTSAGEQAQRWGLGIISVMVLGGWIATLTADTSVIPIASFTLTTLPVVVAVTRLNPDAREITWLMLALICGVLASTLLGVAGLRSPNGRALGFAHHSNQFTMQIDIALPLLWLLWRRGRIPLIAFGGGLLVFALGILQSGSRSGLLAFSVVVVIGAWRVLGPVLAGAVAVAAGCITALGLLPTLDTPTTSRLLDSDLTASSNDERVSLMDQGLARLLHDPILGVGLPRTDLPHNIFLLVWGGMGLIGLIAFVTLMWRVATTALLTPTSSDRWAISMSALGFLVVLAVNNAIGTPAAWLIIGFLQVSYLGGRTDGELRPSRLQRARPRSGSTAATGVAVPTGASRSTNSAG